MKIRIFATLSSLALLTAAAAFAQSGRVMYADIPFEFRVGATILPAGHYELVPQTTPGVLVIRCLECKHSVITITGPIGAPKLPEKGSLVFNRYAETYFLSRIWTPAEPQGRELTVSKSERQLLALGRPGIPPVEVALAH